MPEGPLGGPRPLASDDLEGTIIFIGSISGEVVAVPVAIREQEDLRVGEVLNVDLYPLYLFEFRSEFKQSMDLKIGSQFRLSMSRVERSTTIENRVVTTDKILVSIKSVTIPDRRRW